MRNLKRALSLILAAAMLIGMMVVGAGAVSYNDFPDRDEIVNKDAVSMLTTLGIIEGTDQGTYNPTGNVDRAQMAKMISVALTNNENCDTLYMNVDSGLTDIAANWARGYINYCYTLGIIAGRGNNTFDPSANVTGVEAAKMLLAALGYDAEIEGLVGTDWALNTAALAQNLGIFRNFTKDVSEPLNRDDAALLIYNALDVELIQEYRNGYAISYDDHRTILSSVFGVIRVEGVVIGNEWAQLEETDSDAALQAGRTRLEDVVWYDSTTANTVVDEGVVVTDPVTFNVATPVDYMGKAVTLYVEKTTILSNSVVIGVATNDDMNTVVSSAANQAEDDDLLDGTGVSVDNSTQYYVNYGYQTRARALDLINDYDWDEDAGRFNNNGVEVEVIDNDDDGTAEYVLYTRETLSNVVRTSSRDETTTINVPVVDNSGMLSHTGNANNPSYTTTQVLDNEDIVTDLELAADDLILYVQYGGRTYITAPEIVTDTMTRVDRDRNNEQYITLSNGDTYRMSYIREVLSMVDADVTRFEFTNNATTADFDTTYEWILDSNGYIVDFRPAEETVKNYGLVLDSAWTLNALTRSGEVKILDTNAIEHTYTINWSASVGNGKPFATNTDLEEYLGTRDVNSSDPGMAANYNLGAAKGTVIEYTLNEAGDRLTITNVFNLNTLGSDNGLADSVDADQDKITVDVDSNAIAYMEKSEVSTITRASDNLQYTMTDSYDTGDGNLLVSFTNPDTNRVENKTYAIDRNTVAFYYDVVEDADLLYGGRYYQSGYKSGDVLYGVATGWNQMGDVANGTKVQVYPVISKQGGTYAASNLADVVLFNYELTTDTADWMLVLNANAVNSETLELNVVFEDGTTAAIEVDRDDYDDTFYNNSNAYMKAYKYAVNANGEYTISESSAVGDTPASLLRDGTVDTNSAYQYLTITGDSKIWDVTDVDNAEDEVVAGSFDYANAKHAVIVRTNNNQSIKTAWVWDMDGDPIYGTSCTFNWNLDNYQTVWAPNGTTVIDWMAYSQILDAFDAGKNVLIMGNAILNYPINIPADRTLQVEGNLTTSATGNVTGNGSLRVRGTFNANADIRVNTQAVNLYAANDITIAADTHVQNYAQLGTDNLDSTALTIATGVHLCARDYDNTGIALEANDYVWNNGHIETTGDAHFHAGGHDVSTNSMVINGDLYLCDTFTVGNGTSAGSLTIVGGTIYSGATVTCNDGDLVVNNGTVTLTSGSAINMDGDLTVNANGRISQSYSYNARDVIANTVTVNGGEVAIYGDLVGLTGVDINGAADVRADEINAVNPNPITIESGASVSGNIANNTTPVIDSNGNRTYGGNYDGTVNPPEPGTYRVTVTVDGATYATQDVNEGGSYSLTYTAPEGKVIASATEMDGVTVSADNKTVTIKLTNITAAVTIAITTKDEGSTQPQPGESEVTVKITSGSKVGDYVFTYSWTGEKPDTSTEAGKKAVIDAINVALTEKGETTQAAILSGTNVYAADAKTKIGTIAVGVGTYNVYVNGTFAGTVTTENKLQTVPLTVETNGKLIDANTVPGTTPFTVKGTINKTVEIPAATANGLTENLYLVDGYQVKTLTGVTATYTTPAGKTGEVTVNNYYPNETEFVITGTKLAKDGNVLTFTFGQNTETRTASDTAVQKYTVKLDVKNDANQLDKDSTFAISIKEEATNVVNVMIDGKKFEIKGGVGTANWIVPYEVGNTIDAGKYVQVMKTSAAVEASKVITATIKNSDYVANGMEFDKALTTGDTALTIDGYYVLVSASKVSFAENMVFSAAYNGVTPAEVTVASGSGNRDYYIANDAILTIAANAALAKDGQRLTKTVDSKTDFASEAITASNPVFVTNYVVGNTTDAGKDVVFGVADEITELTLGGTAPTAGSGSFTLDLDGFAVKVANTTGIVTDVFELTKPESGSTSVTSASEVEVVLTLQDGYYIAADGLETLTGSWDVKDGADSKAIVTLKDGTFKYDADKLEGTISFTLTVTPAT